jgi:hypothetical protein
MGLTSMDRVPRRTSSPAVRGHKKASAPVGAATRGSMLVGVVAVVLLMSACGGTTRATSATGSPAASVTLNPKATARPSPEVTEKPATTVPKPADALSGKYVPVKRNGKTPDPSISAPPAAFTKAVRYVDGTTLTVTSIHQGTVSGQGPGVFPGQPITTFGLRLTNGTTKAINLNQVVVTATYGNPKRVASPVYSASSHDFTGTAAPGAFVNATYAFSIPTASLGAVVMLVDFDGMHASGTFEGSAR